MKRARHQSVPKELKLLVARIEKLPCVTKVVLGEIESCRHRYPPGSAKELGETAAGLRLKGYFGGGVMHIFVVTEEKETVRSYLLG